MFWSIFGLFCALKLLFIPAYHSTDFEVHRNWLAITHSKPIKEWYFENTSEWTLDYPPFFAYFEFLLSQIAQFFDKKMLYVDNLNYASPATILFQRISVIFCDLIFAFGIKKCLNCIEKDQKILVYTAALTLGNIGLLIVDHIHFQYNGILFGIMLLSIAGIYKEHYLRSAFLFAILLHMKHIFVYIAPVYFIFLLKFYCLAQRTPIKNLLMLGLIVIGVTLISFGPFWNQIPQVFSRLFPFKRGLSHAYWAPNFWAFYNFADKILSILLKVKSDGSSTSSGLVQTFNHSVLPSVSPLATFVLTFITILPCIWRLTTVKCKIKDQPIIFIQAIVLCASSSFLFGWHVHEKAILMIIIPLSLLTYLGDVNTQLGYFIGIVGYYSLFPLLFNNELILLKTSLLLSYIFFTIYGHSIVFNRKIFNTLEIIYLTGFIFLYLYENFIHQFLFNLNEKLPFLPLMLTSVYCTVGVFHFWIKFYRHFLFSIKNFEKIKVK